MSAPIDELRKRRTDIDSDADRSKAKASLKQPLNTFIDRQKEIETTYQKAYDRLRTMWRILLDDVGRLHHQLQMMDREDVFDKAKPKVKEVNEIKARYDSANPVLGRNEKELAAADAWKTYAGDQFSAWLHNETGVEKQLQLCNTYWIDIDARRHKKEWPAVIYLFYSRLVPELFSLCPVKELADPDDQDLLDLPVLKESRHLLARAGFTPGTRNNPAPEPLPVVPPEQRPTFPASPKMVPPEHLFDAVLLTFIALDKAIDVSLDKKAEYDADPDDYKSLGPRLATLRGHLDKAITDLFAPTP